ncbi:hypothetical protein GCHA_1047 [Paraglaciecola chathamensis S18K6]|uniref:Uncharacterized protein n=1 Tax=Paraglaciecola chathamensis S18K6 TaxID=1127672 RepID=A0AAV3UVI7_9ALTE|nr:hypothetical protein GCHA_1047 [Paraglaciecola chathamensis S18K6]
MDEKAVIQSERRVSEKSRSCGHLLRLYHSTLISDHSARV